MDIPGFYFCVCPDSALAMQHVAERFSSGSDFAGHKVFWSDEGLDSTFWNALSLQQLDMHKRLLVIRNAQALNSEAWKKLSASLARPLSSALPVFCLEVPWEKGSPRIPAAVSKLKCFQFAEKKQWVWREQGITGKNILSYISNQLRVRSLKAESRVLSRLSEIAIPDAAAISNLLDQLSLASDDGTIHRELVDDMSAFTTDAVIFDIIRNLENGKPADVWKAVLSQGEAAESLLFPLLTLMAREARMLWQMNAGEKTFCQPFLENEKRRLAGRLGFSGISRLFTLLFNAESSVKSGKLHPVQAFDHLTAELSLLFSQSIRRS